MCKSIEAESSVASLIDGLSSFSTSEISIGPWCLNCRWTTQVLLDQAIAVEKNPLPSPPLHRQAAVRFRVVALLHKR